MRGVRLRLHRVCVVLTVVTESIAAVLLALIVVANFLAVFYRYVLFDPIGWTEEGMRYAVVWATFLASSAALYRGEHMVLDLFGGFAMAWLRWALHLFVLVCVGTFCVVVIWYAWPLALRNWRQVSPTMNIQMFWPYASVAVGFTLMLFKTFVLLVSPPGFAAHAMAEADRQAEAGAG